MGFHEAIDPASDRGVTLSTTPGRALPLVALGDQRAAIVLPMVDSFSLIRVLKGAGFLLVMFASACVSRRGANVATIDESALAPALRSGTHDIQLGKDSAALQNK